MKISIDGAVRLDELIADGVLVSTPGGIDRHQTLGQRSHRAAWLAADDADADFRSFGRGAGAARCCPTTPASPSTFSNPTSARSPPPRIISKSAGVARVEISTDHDTTWCCCTTPATRSTSACCASSSAIEPRGTPLKSSLVACSQPRRQ